MSDTKNPGDKTLQVSSPKTLTPQAPWRARNGSPELLPWAAPSRSWSRRVETRSVSPGETAKDTPKDAPERGRRSRSRRRLSATKPVSSRESAPPRQPARPGRGGGVVLRTLSESEIDARAASAR